MTRRVFFSIAASALILSAAAQSPVVAPPQTKQIILKGGTIHTGTGQVINNGVVAFSEGKITFAGRAGDFIGDTNESETIDVTGKQVYPGLIYGF